jgi:hypothetical protein
MSPPTLHPHVSLVISRLLICAGAGTSQADDKPCRFLAGERASDSVETIYDPFELTRGIKAVLKAVPVRRELSLPCKRGN